MLERVIGYLTVFAFLAGAWLWSADIQYEVYVLRRSVQSVEEMAEHLCRFVKEQDHYTDTRHLKCETYDGH